MQISTFKKMSECAGKYVLPEGGQNVCFLQKDLLYYLLISLQVYYQSHSFGWEWVSEGYTEDTPM